MDRDLRPQRKRGHSGSCRIDCPKKPSSMGLCVSGTDEITLNNDDRIKCSSPFVFNVASGKQETQS
jgi:hypothetical protein